MPGTIRKKVIERFRSWRRWRRERPEAPWARRRSLGPTPDRPAELSEAVPTMGSALPPKHRVANPRPAVADPLGARWLPAGKTLRRPVAESRARRGPAFVSSRGRRRAWRLPPGSSRVRSRWSAFRHSACRGRSCPDQEAGPRSAWGLAPPARRERTRSGTPDAQGRRAPDRKSVAGLQERPLAGS